MNEKNNKDASLGMRVSTADKARITKLAKQSGLTVSEYVARAATAQVDYEVDAIKAFMKTDTELSDLNLWFYCNCEMMETKGYVLSPYARTALNHFMDALIKQVDETLESKLKNRNDILNG